MTIFQFAAFLLLLSAAANHNVTRTLWALCNLIDTLRSLREVRANGRRVGVATRRKLIKQCLIGWIVFVAAQPVGLAADATLFWFPFYKSLKTLVTLVLVIWRLETSGMLFENFIAPMLKRHETHIDLSIQLAHSVWALVSFFIIDLPWHLVRSVVPGIGAAAQTAPREGTPPRVSSPPRIPPGSKKAGRTSLYPDLTPKAGPSKPTPKEASKPAPKTEASKPAPKAEASRPKSTKPAVSKVAERKKVFEAAAQAPSQPKPGTGRRTLAKSSILPHPTTSSATAARRIASAPRARTAAELLASLPAPPAFDPNSDSDSPPPPSPPPRPPTPSQPESPKKRPRPLADDPRPVKRSASGKGPPPPRKPSGSARPRVASGSRAASASGRVVSGTRKAGESSQTRDVRAKDASITSRTETTESATKKNKEPAPKPTDPAPKPKRTRAAAAADTVAPKTSPPKKPRLKGRQ